jgi:hypothetical protein
MPEFPHRLSVDNYRGAVFEREPELYAVRQQEPASQDAATTRQEASPVAVVRDGATSAFAVYRGQPGKEVNDAEVRPVYSVGPDGPLAVPTGRVLVRLAKGMSPEARKQEFASAGYEIETTLPYAPSAAWLKPQHGGVAHALSNLDALGKMPGVDHVEPQLLMERAFRRA